jgi:hypothetical protein
MGLTKKHKTFSITKYYRGMEFELLCVTTSKKKFSEITGISLSHINGYSMSYDLRYQICNESPDKLFAKPGLGGEIRYILNRDDIKPYEEFLTIIDTHRETYSSYNDYLTKTNRLS